MTSADRSDDPYRATRLGLVAVLLEGDAGAAFHLVLGLLDEGIPLDDVLFDVLAPVQGDVGRRWAEGDYRVGDEHAVSAAVETVLAMLAGSFDQPDDGKRVVVAAAEGDTHSLPSRLLTAHLAGAGLRVTNLGPTLPADELGAFLAENHTEALVLTCSMSTHLWGARRCIAASHAVGVPVVAGGRGFGHDPLWAVALGADVWAERAKELAAIVQSLDADVEAAEEGVLLSAESQLTTRMADIAAVAETLAGSGSLDRVVWDDVRMYVDALDAALLVDDPLPLVELAAWHRRLRAESGWEFDAEGILAQLAERFGDADSRVRGFIQAAGDAA